jgi:AAA domain
MSIHERDLEGHLTRALHEILAGREPEGEDVGALTGEARACMDALINALHTDGVQAVHKAFTALIKDRPWLGKLAAQASTSRAQPNLPHQEQEEPRYQLHRLDYFKNLPQRDWNIEGLLRDKGSSVFFGDGGCGKSAVVLSMMLHKAYGLDWIGGRKVKPGLVVWIAAEGEDEIYPRASAWMLQHGMQEEPNILYIDEIVPLNNTAEIAFFIERIQQQIQQMEVPEPITSMVIDTYAECSPGADENDTKEAKILTAAVHQIRKTFDTHVVLIHHTNTGGRMRGSTVLRGYVNTAVKVTRDGGVITLHCDKQRGAPEFEDIRLRMVSQLLSETDPHDTAPVVVAAEAEEAGKGTAESRSAIQQALLEILGTHQRLTSGDFLRKCVKVEVYGAPISESAFYRNINALVKQGCIAKEVEEEEAPTRRKKARVWYSMGVSLP